MLITFTTKQGVLVIRAEDLRSIEDRIDGCSIAWETPTGVIQTRTITGTAAENHARIVVQETQAIAAYETASRRAQQQAHVPHVPRGKAGTQ